MFHIFYIVRGVWAKTFIGVLILTVATLALASGGQRVELGWDAQTGGEVVGYRLKYGTASGSYGQEVDVVGVTVGAAENLAAGTTYYFVVTAYNQDGAESVPSEELAVTTGTNPLPVVSLVIPGNSYGWTSPASLTLKASAIAGVGTIQRVEFYSGAEKLGEDRVAPYALTWGGVGAGSYRIVARAFDDQGGWSDSTGMQVVV
ncbi:MAG: Ig-like domain-containing protein, partial [Verrucomicrobiota bacterium]